MALTYRGQLDRPLTAEEIDANFAYFTGSHGITGSLGISGSIIPAVGVGQLTSSFSLGSPTAAWKDIYVSEGSIKFIKSGSEEVVLSAKDGGIQVNGGPTISADGINGQFFTSKSLETDITVKDSNNSLLMGPIDVEEGKEIIVEEDSDLTIFGDIEVTDVANADNSIFAISSSYSSEAISSSYASSASFSDTSSFATTASYALNSSCSCTPFPYSGSAVITGSLIINNGTNNVVNTSNYQLLDSSEAVSVDWENRILKGAGGADVVNWENKVTYDNVLTSSIDWGNRLLYNNNNQPSIDWQNGLLYRSNNTLAIDYNTPGIYGFVSASSSIINTTPGASTNVQVAFAQSGSNFFIYAYIGGQWRSASLS